MAIDPQIALGYRPPVIAPLQLPNPIEQFGKMISLRNLMTQGQLGQLNVQQTQLENERLQKSAQEEQNLGSWMQQNQDRQDLTPQEIIAAHPNATGVKFATAWSAQQKANMEAHSAAITNRLNDQKAIDRELQGITDNPTKNAALATAVKNGWLTSDQAAPYLSMDVADPKWKDFTGRVQAQTIDATQRAEAARKLIELRIAQATEGAVTKKATSEATKAEQEVGGTQPITLQQKAQAEQQLWTDPGGLIAIMNDPNRSAADKARAAAGLEKHEGLKRAGAATTSVITPNQNVANESRLRDDYRQDTKTYVAIRDAYNKIVGAAQSASAAGDIGLVYGFMRMQDPGSTVREGEFATAQNAGGIPERVRAIYNKAINGERLDPAVRADFVAQAEKIHGQSYADYLKTKDMYSGIATRGGMDPRNVVIDYSTAKPARKSLDDIFKK